MQLVWICIALGVLVFSNTNARYASKNHLEHLERALRRYHNAPHNDALNIGAKGGSNEDNSPEKADFIFSEDENDDEYTYGDYRYNYHDDEDYKILDLDFDLGSGVEPLNPDDIGRGIVPDVTEAVQFEPRIDPLTTAKYLPRTEKPPFSWNRLWNNVGDKVGNWGKEVGDTVGNWGEEVGETFSDLGDTVGEKVDDWGDTLADVAEDIKYKFEGAFDDAQDKVQEAQVALVEAAKRAGEGLKQTYQDAKDGLPTLREQVLESLRRFGILVSDGAKYVYSKITQITDQVHSSAIIQKLQEKLDQGDAQVTEFLQLIGYKATELEQQQQDHHNVEILPDIFQDEEVQTELQNLVDAGTLTQGDFYIITQHQNQKTHIKTQKHVYNRRGWSDSVGESFNSLSDTLSDTASDVGDTVSGWGNQVAKGAQDAAAEVVDAADDVVGKRGYSSDLNLAEKRMLRSWLNSRLYIDQAPSKTHPIII